jgi:hypothetical protein
LISTFFFWTAIGTVIATVYASIFEWLLHKFLMHRPIGPFDYPFKSHALVHHRIFKSDHTYHLINERDKVTIPMAWWNGPALVAIASLPFLLTSLLAARWGILCGAALAIGCYYGAYEYMHWCMHLPRRRHVERSGIFFRLNGHHLLHHRYMNRNYNVVLPLADLCFGTLLLRSKVHFRQASGPSVPNVQPRQKRLNPAESH